MFKRKKWTPKIQAYFLMKFSELLLEGFIVEDALQFLKFILPTQKNALTYISEMMKNGKRFDETMDQLNFHPSVIAQVYLAQENGQFAQVVYTCGQEIEKRYLQLKKLKRLLTYPLVLLVFIFSLLLGIRQFFLPQLMQMVGEEQHQITTITLFMIRELPYIVGISSMLLVTTYLAIRYFYRQKSALEKILFLHQFIVFRHWISLYYTAYLSRELSYFYEKGYSLTQIIQLLKAGNTSLFLKEFGLLMNAHANAGKQLADVVAQLSFLRKDMQFIIRHGEKISQMPLKLKMYAQECFLQLETDIERKLALVQPCLFLVVGIIVALVYLTLMLPMLSMMDTLLVG